MEIEKIRMIFDLVTEDISDRVCLYLTRLGCHGDILCISSTISASFRGKNVSIPATCIHLILIIYYNIGGVKYYFRDAEFLDMVIYCIFLLKFRRQTNYVIVYLI